VQLIVLAIAITAVTLLANLVAPGGASAVVNLVVVALVVTMAFIR